MSIVLTTSQISSTENQLDWTASTLPDLSGYNIIRDGSQIDSVGSGTLTYIDSTAVSGVCYDYKVVGFSSTDAYNLGLGDTMGWHWQTQGDAGIVQNPENQNPLTMVENDDLKLVDGSNVAVQFSYESLLTVTKTGGTIHDPVSTLAFNPSLGFDANSDIHFYAVGDDVIITDITIGLIENSNTQNQCTEEAPPISQYTVIAISNKLEAIPSTDCSTQIVRFSDVKFVYGFDYLSLPYEQQFRLGIYLRTPKRPTKEKVYRQTDGNYRRGSTFTDKTYELNTDQWDENFHDAMEVALRHKNLYINDVSYFTQGEYQTEDNDFNNLENGKATIFEQGYNSTNISC